MRTWVKICGITRVDDALAVRQAGCNALGLVFYEKSKRAVSAEQAKPIVEAVSGLVSCVGLFVNSSESYVREVLQRVPLDVLQFHGDETPEFCSAFGLPYLKAVRVKPGLDIERIAAMHHRASALLLDAYVPHQPGGTGETFDWALVPHNLSTPVILAGGLSANNVELAVNQAQPFGVDVSGGVERAPGIKDAQAITEFIRGVSRADFNRTA